MQKTIVTGLALAASLSAAAMMLASPAEAGKKHRHGSHRGNAAAAAIIGLGAAAIFANPYRNRRYYDSYGYRPYYYRPPPYVSYAPPRVYSYAPARWSPAWYRYCKRKYRSFDPRTGTFKPYRGPRRLCR